MPESTAGPTVSTAPVLSDDTITLDAYRTADVDAMQAGADPEIVRWINEGHVSSSAQDLAAVARWEASWQAGGEQRTWAIRARRSGELFGGCELRLRGTGVAAFSYWVYPAHRGRWIATRALILTVDHAFTALGVARAELSIEVDNTASHRVAAAAGFRREGGLRAVLDHLGRRRDAVSWSRLPTDPAPTIPDRARAGAGH